jgi:glycolate oxidase iron-sulfur subunit
MVRQCVHCGFCSATCPTYQLLGDELDSPRGRIYQIKQVLEGEPPSRSTQLHLDRCLSCRNCESTCPSGVPYGQLIEVGRALVAQQVSRPRWQRLQRWLLREGLNSALFAPVLRLGQGLRAWLPAGLQAKVPRRQRTRAWPQAQHARKVLLLAGCVQPALLPNINGATARVLDAAGIQTLVAAAAGCCGALRQHLDDAAGARRQIRRNIDAWWPLLASGQVEAIVMNASACALMVREYGALLSDDPDYAVRAARVSALARDLSELLPELSTALAGRVDGAGRRLAFHPPCTLQHGLQLRGGVEGHLRALGFEVELARDEAHLCCGSAGTYSVLQPALANQLRERKLAQLEALAPHTIISANVGCLTHLQSGTRRPVRHWVEVLDQALLA